MFGKKKPTPQIDKDQLELIENAQKRIKQKKRLYIHFVLFLIGCVFLIVANTVLKIAPDFKPFGKEWFLSAIILWLFILLYHFFNVFVTHKFMGKPWEKEQLEKLVSKQQQRIDKLKAGFVKEETLMAQSDVYNETNSEPQNTSSKPPSGRTRAAPRTGNRYGAHTSQRCRRFTTSRQPYRVAPRIAVNNGYCFAGNAAIYKEGIGEVQLPLRKKGGPVVTQLVDILADLLPDVASAEDGAA